MKIPPSLPPSSQPSDQNFGNMGAYGAAAHVFGQAAAAAGATTGVSGAADPNDPNTQWYITMQALGDLAAIDMALRHGNLSLALKYAQDLHDNCSGKATAAMNTIISGMMKDFTMSGGTVTGFTPSSGTDPNIKYQFQFDWMQPQNTDPSNPPLCVGGLQQAFALLQNMPSTAINPDHAMNMAYFFLFLSDAMLSPTVTLSDDGSGGTTIKLYNYGGQSYDLSTYIWGNVNNGQYEGPMWGGMAFQDLLPMVIAAAFYEKDGSSYSSFQSDLSSFISLFPSAADIQKYNPNFASADIGYQQMLGKLDSLNVVYPQNEPSGCTFPPKEFYMILEGPPYNWPANMVDLLFQGAGSFGSKVDMTDFFSELVSQAFDQFTSGGPF